MGLVRNLKKTLTNLAEKILVELSYHYIKQRAKQTMKRPDNSSSTMSSQKPLTLENQRSTIAMYCPATSEKTTMMETEDIVAHVRSWAIETIDSKTSTEQIYDQLAIIDEFEEWLSPRDEEIEIVSLDEISEEEYDNYVDGIERS